MASNGNITTNTDFGYVRLAWSEASRSIEKNTTTINWTLSVYRSSAIYSSAAKSYSVTINGIKVAAGTNTIGGSGTKTIKTGTATIPHNADGAKTFAYSFSQQIDITWSGAWIGTVTGSGSGTLNTIPRASTPTLSASTFNMGSAITIRTNPAASSFTHTLTCKFGAQQFTIATGVDESVSWTPPLTMANAIPAVASGKGTITCTTYNGSALIGTKTVEFTANVPVSVKPTISSVAISEAVSGIATKFGAYVQNKSKLAVTITAAGAYSSTITKYTTTILGKTYAGRTFTSGVLTASGTVAVAVTVEDSRGRTAQTSVNVTGVLAYTAPLVRSFSAYRCDASGNADDNGTRVKVLYNFSIAPAGNLNDKAFVIQYRLKGASSWTGLTSGQVYSANTSVVSGELFSVDSAYDLRIVLTDFFTGANGVIGSASISTAFTLVDFRSTGKGIAFGKVSTADKMEIALNVALTGTLEQEARINATMQNGWVPYEAGYEPACFWKDTCGCVHITGVIKNGTTAANTVLFTLPAGYRPRAREAFWAMCSTGVFRVDVFANGNVAIFAAQSITWISLSGITFRAA